MSRTLASASRRFRGLMTSSALGGSLLAFGGGTPAAANNECGVHTPGTSVVCTAAGGPYGRVSYSTSADLTLQLEDGAVLDDGLHLRSDAASLRVLGPNATVSSSDTTVRVYDVETTDVNLDLGIVSHTGASDAVLVEEARTARVRAGDVTSTHRAINVYAQGDSTVQVGSVTGGAEGLAREEGSIVTVASRGGTARLTAETISATGLTAAHVSGDRAVVSIGSIKTVGNDGAGLSVESRSMADVTVRSILTNGDYAAGVVLTGGGEVVLDLADVETIGTGSYGVYTEDNARFTRIEGNIDSINTGGNGSTGLYLYADVINLTGGSVTTSGDDANGVYLNGYESVTFDFDSISTAGEYATALGGWADQSLDLRVQQISTQGNNSAGVDVWGDGDISVRVGSVETVGDGANAIVLASQGVGGNLLVEANEIRTLGDSSRGVLVSAEGSQTTVDVGSVTTGRRDANGVTGQGAHGVTILAARNATVRAESILTHGDGADAVYLDTLPLAEVEVNAGTLTTHGDISRGANILMGEPGVAIMRADAITTSGRESQGVLISNGGSIEVDVGAVVTTGERSVGLDLESRDLAIVKADSVATAGANSTGVLLRGAGDITLDLGDILTSGNNAAGILTEINADFDLIGGRVVSITATGENAPGARLVANTIDLLIGSITSEQSYGADLYGRDSVRLRTDSVVTSQFGIRADGANLVDLIAGEVSTSGDNGKGVDLRGAAVRATLGKVSTVGSNAEAVRLSSLSEGGSILLQAKEIITAGASSAGAIITAHRGSAVVDVERVTTRGEESAGLVVNTGVEGLIRAAAITTTGHTSSGLVLEGVGDVGLDLGDIRTEGSNSTGVLTLTPANYALLDGVVRSVETTGDNALGLKITAGEVDLTVGSVSTLGVGSTGIDLTAGGDIAARIGRIAVEGAGANGLRAVSGGDQNINVSHGVISNQGVAVDLRGNEVNFTLGQGGVVRGGEVGIQIASDAGSHVVLNGTVSARDGMALDIKGGATVIDNLANTIEGHISLTDNDDVLNNAGRFTAGGLSDFGDGNDVLNNTGMINLFQGTTPRTATFVGLERLNNAGVIGLANGVAQDVLAIDGILNGQAGNRVELDLDLRGATPLADHISARGFEGLTNVVLNVQGRANLGDTGVVIARSLVGQTGAEMDVTVAQGGFVNFNLLFANGEYRLNGDLAPPAFEPTKVATGAQHQWTSGADVVSARFEQMSDGGRRGERGDQVWTQIFGGSNDIEAKRSFDVFGEALSADLSHEVKSRGVQAGVDRTAALENSDLTFGMLAGAGRTELRFRNGDETRYDGVGVGAYAHWLSGPLSVGVLAKLDTFKLDFDWVDANLKTRSDGFTAGARVDAAWRMAFGDGWYVEPQASLSWSDTSLGRMKARDGNEVVFGDTSSLTGRIGVRAGFAMTIGEGLRFRPYAAAHVLNEFDGDNVSSLLMADEAVRVADRAHGAWGRTILGASLDAPSGLGGYFQAESDFGKVEGFTARAGVKFSW